jgi:hypothetical protein
MNYTHEIRWNEYHDWLGMFVAKSFRTTSDAVSIHLKSLKIREYDVEGNQNITGIKVVEL